ncbi:hypothetical protein OROGR_032719 [Orobanche gracilis]
MWARFRTSLINEGMEPEVDPRFEYPMQNHEKIKQSERSHNVDEEYLCAVKTKSFADFFLKFQLLVNEPSSSSSSLSSPPPYNHLGFSEILLQPGQETITSMLESSSLFSSNKSPSSSSSSDRLKSLIINYFDISAEASNFCSHLLKTLIHLQSDYKFIHDIIDAIDDDGTRDHSSDRFSLVFSELHSRVILDNPFSNGQNFKHIHDKHSSVLHRLRSNRKKVTRKIKVINLFNRASGVCMAAAHTLTSLLIAPPVILNEPGKPMTKRVRNFRLLISYGFLRKIVEQLDVAAKGAYILDRDFETMSRLVARLGDEIEHNKAMIKLCLDRREDKLCFQVLKEIKKYEFGFKKKVDELEEHVYLCLVTINRARAMVVKEISKNVV